jgi:adenylate kinase
MVEVKISETPATNGFIFDGFPRTVAQAEALDTLLQKNNTSISLMIALQVPDEELRQRLMLRGKTSGRSDDQDIEKINNRIQVYKDETLPVANYYQKQGKLAEVNGVGEIDEIFSSISTEIDKHN